MSLALLAFPSIDQEIAGRSPSRELSQSRRRVCRGWPCEETWAASVVTQVFCEATPIRIPHWKINSTGDPGKAFELRPETHPGPSAVAVDLRPRDHPAAVIRRAGIHHGDARQRIRTVTHAAAQATTMSSGRLRPRDRKKPEPKIEALAKAPDDRGPRASSRATPWPTLNRSFIRCRCGLGGSRTFPMRR